LNKYVTKEIIENESRFCFFKKTKINDYSVLDLCNYTYEKKDLKSFFSFIMGHINSYNAKYLTDYFKSNLVINYNNESYEFLKKEYHEMTIVDHIDSEEINKIEKINMNKYDLIKKVISPNYFEIHYFVKKIKYTNVKTIEEFIKVFIKEAGNTRNYDFDNYKFSMFVHFNKNMPLISMIVPMLKAMESPPKDKAMEFNQLNCLGTIFKICSESYEANERIFYVEEDQYDNTDVIKVFSETFKSKKVEEKIEVKKNLKLKPSEGLLSLNNFQFVKDLDEEKSIRAMRILSHNNEYLILKNKTELEFDKYNIEKMKAKKIEEEKRLKIMKERLEIIKKANLGLHENFRLYIIARIMKLKLMKSLNELDRCIEEANKEILIKIKYIENLEAEFIFAKESFNLKMNNICNDEVIKICPSGVKGKSGIGTNDTNYDLLVTSDNYLKENINEKS
jgi:hypothetical protein